MNRKKAICIIVLAAILMVMCVIGIILLFVKNKNDQLHSSTETSTVETVHSSIVDMDAEEDGIQSAEEELVDGEEDEQYIINDIGYEAYMQLISSEHPDDYYDTSEADKAITRYYRRQKIKPQPVPDATTEVANTEETIEKDEDAVNEDGNKGN